MAYYLNVPNRNIFQPMSLKKGVHWLCIFAKLDKYAELMDNKGTVVAMSKKRKDIH